MPAALEFEHITKQYRSLWRGNRVLALDDFSLGVERGEIFGFLGPNGAGKTTAIHVAMGLMRGTSGSGQMLGHPFGHAPTRARVGFLAENVALYHRSAGRLIHFYGALNGLKDPELRQRTVDVLETLELTQVAERNAAKFSRGMLQRVGLAQALVNDPELLLLDEPTSALDPLGRVAVRELLLSARKSGKTVFLSSHLLSEIELICDRVAILHRGRVARLGRTRDLLESRERIEVTARGIDRSAFGGAVTEDGIVRFEVLASGQRAAIERVWTLGGEIVRVNPVRKSLEDIFVELANGSIASGARDEVVA
jgi:ABC-2 type transport system ATP-binding protein